MTDPTKPEQAPPGGAEPNEDPPDSLSDVEASPESAGRRDTDANELRSLLRTAMSQEEPEPVDMLSGVQAKLRERSRGKFYGDGWSTSKAPPISTYLITSLVMLAVVIAVYAVLAPLSGDPADIDTTPKPVHVVPGIKK